MMVAPIDDGLYIGLMSGTSLDGVDAVLADFSSSRARVRGAVYRAFSPALRGELMALQRPGADELHRAAVAANALVDVYAEAVDELLASTAIDRDAITAIGAHGQTVRHRPADGYTWQINNPARLAEATHIGVVADFRSRDVAAGGQGAPLVPAFHAALFQDRKTARAVVNIGGIANITWLPASTGTDDVRGWDTGPGNMLLDAWTERHLGQPFDRDGEWAASGRIDQTLLATMKAEPYFAKAPPKSTGRDLFDSEWLDQRIASLVSGGVSPVAARAGSGSGEGAPVAPQDVQATLLALTADTIADALTRHCGDAKSVLLCGGGARNPVLMKALRDALAKAGVVAAVVQTTDEVGVPSNQVEALAFAWLARAALSSQPGNLPAVTGARGPRILGAHYPR